MDNIEVTKSMDNLPPPLPLHLGGHGNETHIDSGVADYLISIGLKSVVDVGCGPGGMIEYFLKKGINAIGIDGDYTISRPQELQEHIIIHDFRYPILIDGVFDLAWTIEFVEHVEECYIPNYMSIFKKCKSVVMSHAFPGQSGYHHVNCQPPEYWINLMTSNDFVLSSEMTNMIRSKSTMKQVYMRRGLFFINKNQ